MNENFTTQLKSIITNISQIDAVTLNSLRYSDAELLKFLRQIVDAELNEYHLYRGSSTEPGELSCEIDEATSIQELADLLLDDTNDTMLSSFSEWKLVDVITASILSLRARKLNARKLAKKRALQAQGSFPFANFLSL